MGSPYFVHAHVNSVHVVRTSRGFERILEIVRTSMGVPKSTAENECTPEYGVLRSLRESYTQASSEKLRVVVFLEARYDWRDWEKFQRVIILDFSGENRSTRKVSRPSTQR